MDNSLADIQRLMAGAAAGNEDAWDELVRKYEADLLRAARRVLESNPRFKAELPDLMQSFWRSLYQQRDRLKGIDSPARLLAYLREAVRNKVRLAGRQSMADKRGGKRTHTAIDQLDEEIESQQIRDPAPAAIDEAISRKELERLLSGQTPKGRTIIELLIERFTHEEVAENLGISRSEVWRFTNDLRRKHETNGTGG
jgi:RNA polymerase sigma factor (sigma-70 family)